MLAIDAMPAKLPYSIHLHYTSETSYNNFSQSILVPAALEEEEAAVRIFAPIYNTTDNYFGEGQRRFIGVVVPQYAASRLRSIQAVKSPEELPFICWLCLRTVPEATPKFFLHNPELGPVFRRSQWALRKDPFWQAALDAEDSEARPNTPDPKYSSIQRISESDTCIEQSWVAKDRESTPTSRFFCRAGTLEPNYKYSFFCKAANLSNAKLGIDLYYEVKKAGAPAAYVPVKLNLCTIAPCAGFKLYEATFVLPWINEEAELIIATSADRPGARARWKDFAILKAPWGFYHHLE